MSNAGRHRVLRVIIGVYQETAEDYLWVARLAEIVERTLQGYARAGERVRLYSPIVWESLDEIAWPLAAGALRCEVRLPDTTVN
jgi:hypothetical protein